ncbi:unnamed protein product [Periconia digitata]|uniref:Uncharacterized protein n=1 Tax=Periconia digitata TaxID=1303443 RepID=A0A9W4UE74_9PLEO|nr:unnamed protein product [Periconia digitata]
MAGIGRRFTRTADELVLCCGERRLVAVAIRCSGCCLVGGVINGACVGCCGTVVCEVEVREGGDVGRVRACFVQVFVVLAYRGIDLIWHLLVSAMRQYGFFAGIPW